jgi:hypothetical protein
MFNHKTQLTILFTSILIVAAVGYIVFDHQNSIQQNAKAGKLLVLSCLEANNCTLVKLDDLSFAEHMKHDTQEDFSTSWFIYYIMASNNTVYYSDGYCSVFYDSNGTIAFFDIMAYTVANDCPWSEAVYREALLDGIKY